MSAQPTQTTVHRPVPTMQAALPVAAIVDLHWTLMDKPALVRYTHLFPGKINFNVSHYIYLQI